MRFESACILLLINATFAAYNLAAEPDRARKSTSEAALIEASQIQKQAEDLRKKWNRSDFELSLQSFEEASEKWNSVGKTQQSIYCLRQSADLARSLGDRRATERYLTSALRISKDAQLLGEQVQVNSLLALFHFQGGDFNKGRYSLLAAETLLKREVDPLAKARLLVTQAELYLYERNTDAAVSAYQTAIEIWRNSGSEREQAISLLNLGYAHMVRNEFDQSLAVLQDALNVWALINEPRGQSLTYIAIGHTYSGLGNKKLALEAYHNAARDFPENLDNTEKAFLQNGFGAIFQALAEWRLSLEYRLEAFSLFQDENDLYGQLTTLRSVGMLYHKLGDRLSAIDYLKTARKISMRLRDRYIGALVDREMALVLVDYGDTDKAADLYWRSLAYFLENRNPREIAEAKQGLAEISFRKGDIMTSEQLNIDAIANFRLVRDQVSEADAWFFRAKLQYRKGLFRESVESCQQSLKYLEDRTIETGNSSVDRSYRSSVFDRYELLIRLFSRNTLQSDVADRSYAFEIAERSRARSTIDNLNITATDFVFDADSAIVKKEQEVRRDLNTRSDRLIDLLGRGSDKAEIDRLDSEIRKLEHRLEELTSELKQKSPIYLAIKDPPQFDLVGFQANVLDQNDLLLEYFLGNDESYLWMVGKNEFEAFVLPGKEEIEEKIDVLKGVLDARKPLEGETFEERQARIAEADARYAVAARELSNIILGPVAEKIKGKRLIVVPDGKLNYFPISALPMPNSESDDPILLTNEVIYQPSAQTYALLKKIGQERKDERTKDLLVFSDPVFSPADERLTGIEVAAEKPDEQQYRFRLVESFSSLSRLPASKTEAETVSSAVGGSDLFMGFDATRDRLLNTNLSDYRVVHLATHGFLDPERPELSSLVFSRYDQTGKQIDESIRMHDIYSMKLNADLVVLSACQTGTGKEIKGEGVMGLNTAFLQAGARSVVSTLWQVEDNAANQLMKEFYGRMVSDGMSPSAALRAAQIKLYQDPQFRSPFFWAAFTVHGDAATATPFKRDHTKLVISISAAVALGLVGFILLRRRRYRTSKV